MKTRLFSSVAALAVLALSACASAPQSGVAPGMKMETYTKPGSSIVYRRAVVDAPKAPGAGTVAMAAKPAAKAYETFTKPGSSIVHRRPKGTAVE